MNTEPFIIERTFNAPVAVVWKAITNKEEMKEWYFDIEDFKPEVGFEFQFYGDDGKGGKYLHLCRVTEVLPVKKLVHSWKYEGHEAETYVTFELFDESGKTRLRLTQEGLERIAAYGSAFAKENFAQGWTSIIGESLKNYVEKEKTKILLT